MNFLTYEEVSERFKGRTVCIVGSAPSCLDNKIGFIDSHDIVVRINNYKIFPNTGIRTDVFYSFFGSSVKKTQEHLKRNGVKLCMCKCPNSKFIESEWHEKNGRSIGTDFHYIYEIRKDWWFCDTYIPTTERFLEYFHLLEDHIPTAGFACILDVLSFPVKEVYITGFDFMTSGIHNVNERWSPGRKDDPIAHDPKKEMRWLKENLENYPIKIDGKLRLLL